MATIELSAGFVTAGSITRIVRLDDTSSSINVYSLAGILPKGYTSGGVGLVYTSSLISLYSGTPPTGWVATPATTYNTNKLAQWNSGGGISGQPTDYSSTVGNVTITGNTLNISTVYVKATQSGTATWFMVASYNAPAGTPNPDYNDPRQEIIGTVGTSGADLLVNDTSIVAGSYYRISNLQIQLPTSWTY